MRSQDNPRYVRRYVDFVTNNFATCSGQESAITQVCSIHSIFSPYKVLSGSGAWTYIDIG